MAVGLFEVQKTPATVTRHEFNQLCDRMASMERILKTIQKQLPVTLGDQARTPYTWGDGGPGSEPYYHRQDIAGAVTSVAPWVSTTVRFGERLTSTEFVKATAMQAGLLGITFTGLGAAAAVLFNLPWTVAPVTGISGCALSAGALTLLNRSELHSLVTAQADRSKRRAEMRIQIDKPGNHGLEFLYLNSNITADQLREFAQSTIDGRSLAVHKWCGRGALFTRGQFDDLMTELETMGYILPGRGNVGRCFNRKGLALMRGLIEVKD